MDFCSVNTIKKIDLLTQTIKKIQSVQIGSFYSLCIVSFVSKGEGRKFLCLILNVNKEAAKYTEPRLRSEAVSELTLRGRVGGEF